MSAQRDNAHYGAKLELRRYMLRRYHAERPPVVMDCCAGTGQLWRTLRREFDITRYWALDVKPGRGRMKIDSARVLEQPGWQADVIDIDTYGEPWRHWFWLLANAPPGPVTALLTIGSGRKAAPRVSDFVQRWMGLEFSRPIPPMLASTISPLVADFCISQARKRSKIVWLHEVEASGHTRYLGIHLDVGAAPEETP